MPNPIKLVLINFLHVSILSEPISCTFQYSMGLFQNFNVHRGLVTRINGSFMDHCVFVMWSSIKFNCNMDKFDLLLVIIRRMLLSGIALQGRFIVPWRDKYVCFVHACNHCFLKKQYLFVINCKLCNKWRTFHQSWFSWPLEVVFGKFCQYYSL